MTNNELIAQARAWTQTCATFLSGENCPSCSLFHNLAVALEAAQVPERWLATEYKDDEGNMIQFDHDDCEWQAYIFDDDAGGIKPLGVFPTHLAAIAAVEAGNA